MRRFAVLTTFLLAAGAAASPPALAPGKAARAVGDVAVVDADGGHRAVLPASALAGAPDRHSQPLPARTVKLGWTEKLVSGGKAIMVFKVASLTADGATWSVRASVSNLTRRAVQVRRRFGLGLFDDEEQYQGHTVLQASTYAPRLPARLGPGTRWTGTFRGRGVVLPGKVVRVVFGTFRAPFVSGQKSFTWITDSWVRW